MNVFKPGDKVRRIGTSFAEVQEDEICVVTSCTTTRLRLEGKDGKYYSGYFELVPPIEDQIREAEEKLAALKKQKEEQETATYRIGQRFTSLDGSEYILAQADSGYVCLINLKTGNSWNMPIFVENVYRIQQEDWETIIDGCVFTLVK